ncbi:MAG: PadR family transcriptional regulator [Acidimicrobiia bacterium]|nr:PadR family transcriptional regulator [Acidimicrobiia bacterium]
MAAYAQHPQWDIPPIIKDIMEAVMTNMSGGQWQSKRGRRTMFGPGWVMGGPAGPGPWGAGPKASRGDVRLAILFLLAEEPMHGYQMMQELSDRSGGMWRPSPGSVYPTLQQLEDEGLIEPKEAAGKRVFALTDDGRDYLENQSEPAPWEKFNAGSHDHFVGLRDAAFQLGAALIQVATSGDESQVEAARDIVADAKSKVYEILKEDN